MGVGLSVLRGGWQEFYQINNAWEIAGLKEDGCRTGQPDFTV